MSIHCAVTGTSRCCQMPFLLYPFCIVKILQSNKINRMLIQETVYYEVWTDMIMWPRRPKICHLPPADRGKPRGLRLTGLMVWTLVWVRRFEKQDTEWKKMGGPARAIRQSYFTLHGPPASVQASRRLNVHSHWEDHLLHSVHRVKCQFQRKCLIDILRYNV